MEIFIEFTLAFSKYLILFLVLLIFGPWLGLLALALSPVFLVIALVLKVFTGKSGRSH